MPEQRPQSPAPGKPARRWKRTAAVTLLLLGGAVVNVAVAWGFWFLLPLEDLSWAAQHYGREVNTEHFRSIRIVDSPGARAIDSLETSIWPRNKYGDKATLSAIVPAWTIPHLTTSFADSGFSSMVVIVAGAGWPLTSLYAVSVDAAETGVEPLFRSDSESDAPLPWRPIWRGFAVNTAFYAVLVWFVRSIPRAWRTWDRWIGTTNLRAGVVSLLLGALVTIAVAWHSAYFYPFDWKDHQHSFGGSEEKAFDMYQVVRWEQAASCRVQVWRGDLFGRPYPTTMRMEQVLPHWGLRFLHVPQLVDSGSSDRRSNGLRVVEARGWPMLALWGGARSPYRRDDASTASGLLRTGAIPLGTWSQTQATSWRWLPYRPVLPGFLVNTLLYALLLWLLFFAPFAARRMLRHRRGLCEKCAYPIGTWGSPVCTECGAAVSRNEPRAGQNEPRA